MPSVIADHCNASINAHDANRLLWIQRVLNIVSKESYALAQITGHIGLNWNLLIYSCLTSWYFGKTIAQAETFPAVYLWNFLYI